MCQFPGPMRILRKTSFPHWLHSGRNQSSKAELCSAQTSQAIECRGAISSLGLLGFCEKDRGERKERGGGA